MLISGFLHGSLFSEDGYDTVLRSPCGTLPTTLRYNPKDHSLRSHRCENPEGNINKIIFLILQVLLLLLLLLLSSSSFSLFYKLN
jgi:hypothetical protein